MSMKCFKIMQGSRIARVALSFFRNFLVQWLAFTVTATLIVGIEEATLLKILWHPGSIRVWLPGRHWPTSLSQPPTSSASSTPHWKVGRWGSFWDISKVWRHSRLDYINWQKNFFLCTDTGPSSSFHSSTCVPV